jgi:hypothetical protein
LWGGSARGRIRRGVGVGQCRRPVPPSPAATRRCTWLPTTATPTQWPRCSAPARTRPSRTASGTLCRAARHGPTATGRHAAGVLQVDGRATRTRVWAEWRVRGGGGAGARPFVHSSTTFSQRHCTPRPHRCSCALASTRPSAERDAPDRPLLSAHSCACAAVPLRHAQRGLTNTFRGHAHGTNDAL